MTASEVHVGPRLLFCNHVQEGGQGAFKKLLVLGRQRVERERESHSTGRANEPCRIAVLQASRMPNVRALLPSGNRPAESGLLAVTPGTEVSRMRRYVSGRGSAAHLLLDLARQLQ